MRWIFIKANCRRSRKTNGEGLRLSRWDELIFINFRSLCRTSRSLLKRKNVEPTMHEFSFFVPRRDNKYSTLILFPPSAFYSFRCSSRFIHITMEARLLLSAHIALEGKSNNRKAAAASDGRGKDFFFLVVSTHHRRSHCAPFKFRTDTEI